MSVAAKRFPLLRTGGSNETAMKNLFIALFFWQLAWWLAAPLSAGSGIARFCATLGAALIVDCVCNLFRFRRFLCSVSAAVTAGVVCVLSTASPVSVTVVATALALIVGKHLAGGTGKNALNPAMLALAAIAAWNLMTRTVSAEPVLGVPGISAYFSSGSMTALTPQAPSIGLLLALGAALTFSVPGIRFRPFAAIGFGVGFIAIGIYARAPLVPSALTAIFWGCVVMTDPVTVTRRRAFGAVLGIASGSLIALFGLGGLGGLVGVGIALGANALSFVADRLVPFSGGEGSVKLRKAVRFTGASGDVPCFVASETESGALSPERILSIIKDANIEGRGGAGFPAYRKIETLMAAKGERKTLIVNAVECDPGLVHDAWLLSSHGDEIARGISLVMKACGIDEAIIAVKKTAAVSLCLPQGVRVLRVPNRYPVGAERLLIKRATGFALPAGAIPASEGFLVLNVQTVYAINAAVCDAVAGEPRPIGRFITVADLAKKEAKAAYVMPGTSIAEIIDREFPGKEPVFVGGGIMQVYRSGDGDVVGPDCNFIARAKSPRYKESPQCSRCNRCAGVCPAGLDVRAISDHVDSGKMEAARTLGADRCLSCGSCSTVCLAGRNLSYRVGLAKSRNV